MSYLYILVASVMFFAVFYFFLRSGRRLILILENNKIINLISLFVSVVFASSMFAGVIGLANHLTVAAKFLMVVFVFAVCLFAVCKGVAGLEKINLVLMPFATVLFLIVLVWGCFAKGKFSQSVGLFAGWWYCPLYVALNCSMSGIVVAKAGENMTKKQAVLSCLFSAGLLFVFLMMGNFVLRKNPDCFASEMPFLYVAKDNKFVFLLVFFLIFIGCLTTLISLCFTIKNSTEKIIKNNLFCNFVSVFLPLFFSSLGFSEIISNLYPICSVLGIFVLLFSIFSFKQTYKIIHRKSEHTQDGG